MKLPFTMRISFINARGCNSWPHASKRLALTCISWAASRVKRYLPPAGYRTCKGPRFPQTWPAVGYVMRRSSKACGIPCFIYTHAEKYIDQIN